MAETRLFVILLFLNKTDLTHTSPGTQFKTPFSRLPFSWPRTSVYACICRRTDSYNQRLVIKKIGSPLATKAKITPESL